MILGAATEPRETAGGQYNIRRQGEATRNRKSLKENGIDEKKSTKPNRKPAHE
jgi:hypothetical protein